MSIPVEIADLRAKVGEFDYAYVLTVRDDQRPHVVSTRPAWDGDVMVMTLGRGSTANAAARSSISLCYPPAEADGYSLIVDGTATVDGESIRFAPTGAVLHRPAPDGFEGGPTGCVNDCLPADTST